MGNQNHPLGLAHLVTAAAGRDAAKQYRDEDQEPQVNPISGHGFALIKAMPAVYPNETGAERPIQ